MTNKTDAWMPLWIGAYLADTQRLTRDQHGGYLLLIMDYWRNGPPPDDDAVLMTVAKATPKEWKSLRPVLAQFFQITDGKWIHKRVEIELAQSADRKLKAQGRAKTAAAARWKHCASNAPSNAPSIPQALHEDCPTPSPIQKTSEAKASGVPPSPGPVAGPPRAAAPIDPTKAVFDLGVAVLTAAGHEEKHARSLVGKLRKALGDDGAMPVLVAAKATTEPASYIAAAMSPDPVAQRIREAMGGSRVEKLPDGRYRCGGSYFNADGSKRVALC